MSCTITEDPSVAAIAWFIYRESTPVFSEDDSTDARRVSEIAATLANHNINAYNTRYSTRLSPVEHVTPAEMLPAVRKSPNPPELRQIHDSQVRPKIVQLHKTMTHWLYQCGESAELMDAPIFKQVENIRNEFSNELVRTSPEWNAAKWG